MLPPADRSRLVTSLAAVAALVAGCGTDGSAPGASGPRMDGGPDAADDGAPPLGCVCPTLPADCTPPLADAPVFTPVGRDYGELLADTVACASETLDVAIFQTSWDCLVTLFAEQLEASPALTLRVVVDDDQCPKDGAGHFGCAWSALETHPRVTIVSDSRDAYMHHKFVVADGARVWTGSANFTQASFCQDTNDGIVIEEAAIVGAYASVFERLASGSFGPVTEPEDASAGPYRVVAGPKSPLSSLPAWYAGMLEAVEGTDQDQRIDFMIFAFTRVDLSDALLAARARGVAVRGMVAAQYKNETPIDDLVAAGVDVRVAEVHSKALIIDGQTVFAGSPNWSANALENNEMSLRIDDPSLAAAYAEAFEPTFATADPR